jgi:hypothetical protein
MALSEQKITLIKTCWEQMNASQNASNDGAAPNAANAASAYAAMLVGGVSAQDIREFSAQFPDMRMGLSGNWSR